MATPKLLAAAASQRTAAQARTAIGLDRTGYWFFLRRVYGMGALQAWDYIKAQGTPPGAAELRNAISRRVQ